MENALILLAGGAGKRLRSKIPKQFIKIGNANLIEYFLSNLEIKFFDLIVIAIKNKDRRKYLQYIEKKFNKHKIIFAESGLTRQLSSKNSLEVLKKYKPKNVLIHDSARPLASNLLIKKIINGLKTDHAVIPFICHNDLIKTKEKLIINNQELMHIQTPQGFNYKKIYNAHKINQNINIKDDSLLLEDIVNNKKMIKGEITNIKITTKEDIKYFDKIRSKEYRSGIGYDIHKINFLSKKKLTLCGVKIKHPPLIGHSDADVGYHAVCDSILGALSLKDIGCHFKNNDKKWKNIESKIFIKFCSKKLTEKGFKIVNLDINFICETPNINKLANLMKRNISQLLKIPLKNISIKATTNEKIGFIGRGEGIAAESIVQIKNV